MNNFNTRIITLKKDIINIIGKAELPVGVVYYILKDLFNEITNTYNESLVLEQQMMEVLKEQPQSNSNEEENTKN